MTKLHWVRLCVAIAAGATACSDTSGSTATETTDDAGGPSGNADAALEDATAASSDANSSSGAADASGGDGGASTADASAGDAGRDAAAAVDAGGGVAPTITVGEINAVPRNPYAGQRVRLSISLSGGQAPLFWEQIAGPNGRFSSQTGTSVDWSSPGLGARTTYTVQVRVSTAPVVTKTISFTIDPPTYTQLWNDILQPSCRGCHSYIGNTPAAGYAGLVGANHTASAACTSSGITKRVVAGSAQQSLLFRKVAGTQATACGGRMPSAAVPLPIGQVEAIGAWINLGAPNN
jgi:hypothetical protein